MPTPLPERRNAGTRRGRAASSLPPAALALLLVVLLSACGQQPGDPPPATTPSASAGGAASKPPAPSLGSLVDRMDAAWSGVASYRARFTGGRAAAPPGAAPADSADPADSAASPSPARDAAAAAAAAAPEAAFLRIDQEIASPTRRRQVMTGAGANDHEAIVDGAVLYLRGPLAADLVPGTAPDAWLAMPALGVLPESRLGHIIYGFIDAPRSPLAAVGDNLRPQAMRDLGPAGIDGRTCRLWGVADTTEIGARLDISIAVDGANLPCRLETRTGAELVSSVTYDSWGEPIAIAIPVGATAVEPPTDEAHGHD